MKKIQHTLESNYYDFLVIGGGITGAGSALDAVSRGMKTALVEMQDFAAGTSSRSTKLVHGGLRYLKTIGKKAWFKRRRYYVEYLTDDARLTIEVIKTGFEKGAIACNYTKITELVYNNNKICGAVAEDLISGETFQISKQFWAAPVFIC